MIAVALPRLRQRLRSRRSESPAEVHARVARVSRRFGGLRVIEDSISTSRSGEILGVLGPNGAGKSTLFNLDRRACWRPTKAGSSIGAATSRE